MDIEEDVHPHRAPDSHHRKIELQSPHDLTYLQANLVASAKEKLDLHFPPSAAQRGAKVQAQPATVISLDGVASQSHPNAREQDGPAQEGNAGQEGQEQEQEDPLRARVRQLVEAFMARTWEGASKNITVNGMDASSFPVLTSTTSTDPRQTEPQEEKEGTDFVYEAYDARLQAKVAGLYGELEALTAQVSRLRRTAPRQGAEAYRDALVARLAEDEAEFEAQMAGLRDKAAADVSDGPFLKLNPLREGWHDDAKAMYERATGELAALAGLTASKIESGPSSLERPSLTETVGKVQRARNVAMEFE